MIEYIIGGYAVAISLRAILNYIRGIASLSEILNQREQLRKMGGVQSPQATIRFVILLPMLREQLEVVGLLERMDRFAYLPDQIILVPITTQREEAENKQRRDVADRLIEDLTAGKLSLTKKWRYSKYFSPDLLNKLQTIEATEARQELAKSTDSLTTREVLTNLLKQWCPRSRVIPLHFPDEEGNKAAQMNFALKTLRRMGIVESECETYIGVYDADSAPDPFTLNAISSWVDNHKKKPLAFQQYPIYLRNYQQLGRIMRNEAVLQTAHSLCVEYPRQTRVNLAINARRIAGPTFTYCIGHGVFFRSDWLFYSEFPEKPPVEDLSTGFMLSLGEKRVETLPFFDLCTVPSGIEAFIRQTAIWFDAQLEFHDVVNSARRNFPDVRSTRVLRGVGEQVLTNAKWLLAGPFRILAFAFGILDFHWVLVAALIGSWLLESRLEWSVTCRLESQLSPLGQSPIFNWMAIFRPILKSCGPCLVAVNRLLGRQMIHAKTERTLSSS